MNQLEKEKKTAVFPLLALGLLLLLLAAAAYLRLRGLEHSPIRGDQSILLNIALRFVNTGKVPLAANKSSAGIMNPPLITYLLALPLFVDKTLTAVHLFQGLMGVAAVAVLAFYAQRLFGWRVALLATLLFALNPWAVYYSRFVWNPNPIPLFATLLLMSLLAYFAGSRHPAHLTLSFLWLAAITQLHLSGLVLIGVLGLVLLLFWRRQPQQGWLRALAPFFLGCGLVLLLYWPFILFERAVGYTDLQAAATALTGRSGPAAAVGVGEVKVNVASFLLVQELATGNNIWDPTHIPLDLLDYRKWSIPFARFLFIAGLLYIMLVPVARGLRYLWRRRPGVADLPRILHRAPFTMPPRAVALVILALWLLLPILLFLRHTVYLQNYYFLYIYPAPFLAMALMLDGIILRLAPAQADTADEAAGDRKGQMRFYGVHLMVMVPVFLLGLWQFQLYQTWFRLLAEEEIVPGRQAQYIEEAVAQARLILAQNEDCDLTILAEGGNVEQSSLAVMDPFVYPTPVRYVDAGRGYIIPAHCTVYMTVKEGPAAAWLAANGRLRPEQVEAGAETWRFYEVPGTSANLTPQAVWENGLALISTEIEGGVVPNGEVTLHYTWQVLSPAPESAHYHFFNHFVDEAGQLVSQEDAPAIDSLFWQTGDRLVTRFTLRLPPDLADGRYALLLGQYTWPDLVRVPLRGSDETTHRVTTITVPQP